MLSPGRALILALLVVCAQARLEPVRWWWSARDVALVRLTPQQAMAVERLYQVDLPARNRASQEVTSLEEELKYSRQWDAADDELMPLTEKPAKARLVDCQLRGQTLQRIGELLTEPQREQLTDLVRQKHALESTCPDLSGPHDQTSARSDSILRE